MKRLHLHETIRRIFSLIFVLGFVLISLYHAQPSFAATNLLTNGSFENQGGTFYSPWAWTVGGTAAATISQDGTTHADGSYSAKVIVTGTDAHNYDVELLQEPLSITSGFTYTISFYAKGSSALALTAIVEHYASGTIYSTNTPTITTSWAQYTYTFNASATDATTFLGFYFGAATGTYWIDNVQIYENTNQASNSYNVLAPVIDQGGAGVGSYSTSFGINGSTGQNTEFTTSSTHYTIQTGFEYFDYGSSAPAMSISLSGGNINFGTMSPNTFYTGSNTITVGTNAIHGYNLYAQENYDMENLSNNSLTIPAFTGSSTTDAVVWTTNTTNGFGYNVTGTDAAVDFYGATYYRAFDASAAHMIAFTTSPTVNNGTTVGDTTTINYQVSIPTTQAAGTYQNTITYSAVGTY